MALSGSQGLRTDQLLCRQEPKTISVKAAGLPRSEYVQGCLPLQLQLVVHHLGLDVAFCKSFRAHLPFKECCKEVLRFCAYLACCLCIGSNQCCRCRPALRSPLAQQQAIQTLSGRGHHLVSATARQGCWELSVPA